MWQLEQSPGSTIGAFRARRERCSWTAVGVIVLLLAQWSGTAQAQLEFERAPINYSSAPANDRVTALQKKLANDELRLEHNDKQGYLPAVLKALGVEPSSQVLVFSKTSMQARRITPQSPRALYFNDECYVGWVQQGDFVEVMATDPMLGAMFYTVSQEPSPRRTFVRDDGQCLTCHATSRTQGVPGLVVRSVFVDAGGQPQLASGTFTTDHRSPFHERWGGWYVSGTHGGMRHLGNVVSRTRQAADAGDLEAGANLVDLAGRFNLGAYLTPHSDIVALMVLEHQSQMQNYLTLAGYETRLATHHDGVMNAALERPSDYVSDTTERRIAAAGDKLLKYLLFAEEFKLTGPVQGTTDFAKEFQARGPFDSRHRSLREFDLNTRLFKYPCSYVIYSATFDQLPTAMRTHVVRRLDKVLQGADPDKVFAHLTPDDRQAIREILTETKPGLWDVLKAPAP